MPIGARAAGPGPTGAPPPPPLAGDGLGYGPLGRNSGEVLGIVGKIVVTPRSFAAAPLVHDDGSVRTRNLAEMELPAKDLRPPPWPTRGVPPDLCRTPALSGGTAGRKAGLEPGRGDACHAVRRLHDRAAPPSDHRRGPGIGPGRAAFSWPRRTGRLDRPARLRCAGGRAGRAGSGAPCDARVPVELVQEWLGLTGSDPDKPIDWSC